MGNCNLSELAEKTIERIEAAINEKSSFGVPEVIRLIQELSQKAFSISVHELADLISQDIHVASSVVAIANTMAYNPSRVSVKTVSQSIQTIGFERVRSLAISLMLVENCVNNANEQEQKEVSAFALTSGLLAQELVSDYGSGDPEEAFICTALRNYGRLLMTVYLKDEYRQAITRIPARGEDKAFRDIFGLTPLELSYELLRNSKLPHEILDALKGDSPKISAEKYLPPDQEIMAFSELAVRISQMLADGSIQSTDFTRRTLGLLGDYGRQHGIDSDVLDEIVKKTMKKLRQFVQSFGVGTLSTSVGRMLAARAQGLEAPADLAEFSINASKGSISDKEVKADEKKETKETVHFEAPQPSPTSEQIITQCSGTVAKLLKGGKEARRKVDMLCLVAMREAMVLSDIILFDMQKDSFGISGGIGQLYESIRNRVSLVGKDQKDVFGYCIRHSSDILIEDCSGSKFCSQLPSWFRTDGCTGCPQSLILLPILDGDTTVAIVAGIRKSEPSLKIDGGTIQALKKLRTLMAQKRAMNRSQRSLNPVMIF